MRHGAAALVTGDSLGQVSSQTLENLTTIGAAAERLPLFRPLLTMDKGEIIDIARPLGTYPISIIPDQDCCSLFVPRHPVIKSRIEDVERMEAELPVQEPGRRGGGGRRGARVPLAGGRCAANEGTGGRGALTFPKSEHISANHPSCPLTGLWGSQ